MEAIEYRVLRVKPGDLEEALNQEIRQGWQVQSVIDAERSGRSFWGRQTLDVTRYHVILYRST